MSFERIADVFLRACQRESITATATPRGNRLELAFVDQETAPASLILHHFGLELATAGVTSDELLRDDGPRDEAKLALQLAAVELAVRRIRVLLIEHNSYLSGGLPWVFPGGDAVLRARGLSVYRFPKLAAVAVTARGAAMRIAFAPGDLGAITSSGFYVPTRLAGDFEATVRYELPVWRPGPHTASVALFAQDEPSLHRYYSQRNSDPATPDAPRVLANLEGRLWAGTQVRGSAGWFRLSRVASRVSAWHREAGASAFSLLGGVDSAAGNLAPDVYLGIKIWSPGSSDGLVADLHELTILGRTATEQPPLPVVRPDPNTSKTDPNTSNPDPSIGN